jgi:hypothetical protein
MKVVRAQTAAGAGVVMVYGSGQDATGFQTFTDEELKAAVDTGHALGKAIAIHTYGPAGLGMQCALTPTRSSMLTIWTTKPSPKWLARRLFTSRLSIYRSQPVYLSIMRSCCDIRHRPSSG